MTKAHVVDEGFRLTDFRLAGFLSARGVPLLKAELNGKREVVFLFGPGAQDLLASYPGSPEQKYDAACKAMHDVVKVTLGGRR